MFENEANVQTRDVTKPEVNDYVTGAQSHWQVGILSPPSLAVPRVVLPGGSILSSKLLISTYMD